MPVTDDGLPFSGLTPLSRHCSYLGAEDAKHRAGPQTERYLALLRQHPEGLTDLEAADLMGIARSSVNARRAPLVASGVVVAKGTVKGPAGVRNTRWGLYAM